MTIVHIIQVKQAILQYLKSKNHSVIGHTNINGSMTAQMTNGDAQRFTTVAQHKD